jgi:hypothetical protein
MKAITEKQRQWMWFAGLWGIGLVSVLLLAWLVRLALKVL